MSSDLAVRQAPTIENMDDLARVSKMFAESGLFRSAKDAAQAGVQIMAGLECGFGAFASMAGIHIIEGKPTMGANLMALAIKRSGKYNYRVLEHTDTKCAVEILERWDGKWETVGTSKFDMDDAKAAGVRLKDGKGYPTPWAKYPRNMLFARAISNAVRWYCSDALSLTAYVPEELGADVDSEGEVIDVEVTPAPAETPVDAEVKPVEVKAKQSAIGPKRASALANEIKKLGFDVSDEKKVIADVFGESELERLQDLTDGEGFQLLKRLQRQAKEAAKQPWERWATDADAQSWGAKAEGVWRGGHELVLKFDEVKEANPENSYEAWYEEVTKLAQTAANAV